MKEIYLSPLAGKSLKSFLNDKGFKLHFIQKGISQVYDEIATHADIHMCQIGLWEMSDILFGNTKLLKSNYPGNIIYNAVCTGKYFIHNMKYTSKELLFNVKSRFEDITYVNVSQGYTRCNCLPVDDRSFITSDHGIAKALENHDADVLLICPGHIILRGFDYGFIGGCSGNLIIDDRRTLVFNGDIYSHPDFKRIAAFLDKHNINYIGFDGYPLEDIGSILLK